jgi:NitT/TauT family transport system substrate-binding protein
MAKEPSFIKSEKENRNMKKSKRILPVLAAAVVALSVGLGSCTGSPASSPNPSGSGSETAAATLDVGLLGTSIKPVGVIVANAKGYFEEEGVKINIQKVSSMNDAYLAVSMGDLDVYLFSSTAAATFIAQGTTTLRVFGGTAAEGSEIMAAKDKNLTIETPEDFVGLTIACQMPETGQMVLKDFLKQKGYTIGGPGDNADVTFVYVNDHSTAMEGCIKGEYDLCITNACLGYYADDYGVDVVAAVKDFVETYPCCRQTCNQTTYETEADALVKFEIATLRGYDFYQKDPEGTLDILEQYSGEDRDFLRAQVYGTDTYTPVMRLFPDPDKTACVQFYKGLENIGEITDAVDVNWDQYVVTDIYQTALSTLAAREPDNALWTQLTEYFNTHN